MLHFPLFLVFVSIGIYGQIVALRRGLKRLRSYFHIEGSSAISDEPLFLEGAKAFFRMWFMECPAIKYYYITKVDFLEKIIYFYISL